MIMDVRVLVFLPYKVTLLDFTEAFNLPKQSRFSITILQYLWVAVPCRFELRGYRMTHLTPDSILWTIFLPISRLPALHLTFRGRTVKPAESTKV